MAPLMCGYFFLASSSLALWLTVPPASHLLEHMNISFDKYFYNGKIKCLGYTDYFYTYYLFCTDKSYLPECMERVNEIISGIYITDEIMKKIKPDVIEEYYKIIMLT